MSSVAEIEKQQLRDDLRMIAYVEDSSFFRRLSAYFPFAKDAARKKFLSVTDPEHIEKRLSEGFWFGSMQTYAARRALIGLREGLTGSTLGTEEVLEGMSRLLWRPPRRGKMLEYKPRENVS